MSPARRAELAHFAAIERSHNEARARDTALHRALVSVQIGQNLAKIRARRDAAREARRRKRILTFIDAAILCQAAILVAGGFKAYSEGGWRYVGCYAGGLSVSAAIGIPILHRLHERLKAAAFNPPAGPGSDGNPPK